MTVKKRDVSKKRASILDAAQQTFIRDGYENASMDRIAELAGASKRTVYNHFSGKEILFQAVLRRLVNDAIALKEVDYDAKAPLVVQLARFANAKLAFANNPQWLGMMRVTAGVFTRYPDLIQEIIQHTKDGEDTLVSWLQAATDDKRLNVTDPDVAAAVFWSMVSGAFFWPAIFYGPLPVAEAERLKTEILEMFLQRYLPD